MRKIYIAIGLALIVLIGASLYFMNGPASGYEIPEEELRTATEDPTLRFDEQMSEFEFEDWRDVLRDYKKWAIYPPHSRPLSEGQRDLVEYRKVELPHRAMPALVDGDLVNTGAHCLFQPDRHTITEGESVRTTLACTFEDRAVGVRIESAKVTKVGERGPQPVSGRFTYNDKGKDGDQQADDLVTTFVFEPAAADAGDLSLDVSFKIDGVAPADFPHEMKASFFASPLAPARFTGKVDESLEDGSLVLAVEIDVKKAGWYTVEGNLYDLEEQPVAYAREKLKLPTGRQQVRLLYFGKILRDEHSYGPFRLVGLRGERDNSGVDLDRLKNGTVAEVEEYLNNVRSAGPMKEQMPYASVVYQTQEYKEGDFSNREWDSQAKRDRIEMLSKFAQ